MKAYRTSLLLGLLLLPTTLYAGDDDDDDEGGEHRRSGRAAATSNLLPDSPELVLYRAECGSCHLAYPPGLLPARSWSSLLSGLDDHFGQNAELDAASRTTLQTWLQKNAAESGSHPLSRKVLKSAGSVAPLRISELRFIQKEHDEISPAVWKRPAVKTVANCGACHLDADAWSFKESRIVVPR